MYNKVLYLQIKWGVYEPKILYPKSCTQNQRFISDDIFLFELFYGKFAISFGNILKSFCFLVNCFNVNLICIYTFIYFYIIFYFAWNKIG